MKIRIIGNGTCGGTRVTDENGNLIDGVTRVSFELDASKPPQCMITVLVAEIDLDLDADVGVAAIAGKKYRVVEDIPATPIPATPTLWNEDPDPSLDTQETEDQTMTRKEQLRRCFEMLRKMTIPDRIRVISGYINSRKTKP